VRTHKIGVYWETYGYAAGDSVDVAVIISRNEPLSKFRRLGMKLRLAHDDQWIGRRAMDRAAGGS
jgi:hypothetical protein